MTILFSISQENTQAVLSYTPLVMRVLRPTDPVAFEEVHQIGMAKRSLVQKLFGPRPKAASEVVLPDRQDRIRELDLGESLFGLHFLLKGEYPSGTAPLNFLLEIPGPIVCIETNRGIVRVIPPDYVQYINNKLSAESDEAIMSRFSPDAMNEQEIPPGIWDGASDLGDPRDYLLKHLHALRAFISDAATDNRGIVM
jgi:hypothetical protein